MLWQIYRAEKHLNALRLHPTISHLTCQACLQLGACGLQLFLIFFSGQAVASYLMRELLSVSEIPAQLEI